MSTRKSSANRGIGFRALIAERPVVGTFVKLPRPEVVAILASAGFDFLICDMEHAQITEVEARAVIHAGLGEGVPIVVRVPDPTPGQVNRLLEAGAAGIQMPRVTTQSESTVLRKMMAFPPYGFRSVGIANGLAEFGNVPLADYISRAAAQAPVAIGQIETAATEGPLEDVVADLDVAFIGPVDLAVDIGLAEDAHSSALQHRLAEIEAAANVVHVGLGSFAAGLPEAEQLLDRGYRYVALAGDVSFLAGAARTALTSLGHRSIR